MISRLSLFLCPQVNSVDRSVPYNDVRNPAWYVRRLNDVPADFCATHSGVCLVNVEEVAASIGRHHLEDDVVASDSYGAYLTPP
jgi:hypothetical protein